MAHADDPSAAERESTRSSADPSLTSGEPYEYDAFISYRRRDAMALARWIRDRLERYKLPPEVLAGLSAGRKALHHRRPKVWLDKAFEKPSDDFLNRKIYPALDRSARLIVVSTPSVFEPIPSKVGVDEPNWLVREIDRFLGDAGPHTSARPVDVVLGPGGADDRFPGRLAERERWDWIDFRQFTWRRSLGFSEDLDVGLTKLVAGLYDVPDHQLPLLRQEERRRRNRVLAGIAAVSTVVAMIVGVLAVFAWQQQRQATRNLQVADARRLTAESEVNTVESPQLALLLAVESYNVTQRRNAIRLPEIQTNLFALLQTIGGRPLVGHTTQIRSSQFSPDSRWIVSVSSDSIRLWNPRDDNLTSYSTSLRPDQREWVQISPDGSWLAAIGQNAVTLWDLRQSAPFDARVDLATGAITGLVFSPNGRLLAVAAGDDVLMWEISAPLQPREPSLILKLRPGVVSDLAFTPDGSRLIVASDAGALIVWQLNGNLEPGKRVIPSVIAGRIVDLQVSSDNRWILAGGEAGQVCIVDLESLSVRQCMSRPDRSIGPRSVFSPNGRWLADANRDDGVSLWNLTTLVTPRSLPTRVLAHPSRVQAITFDRDSLIVATAAADGAVRVWTLSGSREVPSPVTLRGHETEVRALSISPDGRWLASGGRDDTIRLWDLRATDPAVTGLVLRGMESVWAGNSFGVEVVTFSPDGRWLLGRAYESSPRLWDMSRGLFGSLPLPVAGCPNDVISACGEGEWTIESVKEGRASIALRQKPTSSVDSSRLVIDKIDREQPAGPDARWRVHRLPDGAVQICLSSAQGRPGACHQLAKETHSIQFSPEGRWMVGYLSNGREMWADLWPASRIGSGKPLRLDVNPWARASFDQSGRWLVSTAALWDLEQPEAGRRELSGHVDPINRFAFSSNSAWLATASEDAILLWPLSAGPAEPIRLDIRKVNAGSSQAPAVSFSADNRWIQMETGNATFVWPLEPRQIAQLALRTAGRPLSERERARYLSPD